MSNNIRHNAWNVSNCQVACFLKPCSSRSNISIHFSSDRPTKPGGSSPSTCIPLAPAAEDDVQVLSGEGPGMIRAETRKEDGKASRFVTQLRIDATANMKTESLSPAR